MPCPVGYETSHFTLLNLKEHISCSIDSLGAYARNLDLRLREFTMSFTDQAYTWYTSFAPKSVKREEKVGRFSQKYFQNVE